MPRNLLFIFVGAFVVGLSMAALIHAFKSPDKDDRNIRRPRTTVVRQEEQKPAQAAKVEPLTKTSRGEWEELYVARDGSWMFLYKLDGKEYLVNNQGAIVEHIKAK